jgi:Rrf2 family protein
VFSKETEYALRSLVYIQARNYRGINPGVVEISNEIDSPQFFTAKILHRLVRLGFIESRKGRNGGFRFDPGKPALTLKACVSAIEGERLFTGCGFGLKQCDVTHPCPMHDEYAIIRDALDRLTSHQTIQELALKVPLNSDF